jgi:thiamine pyrophosphate-dependent acetolactate synthase large subunit-like protein
MAHGLFAGRPFALGIAGGFASPLACELAAQADVVVSFGAGLNRWTTRHGHLLAPGAHVIQVDLDPLAPGRLHGCELALVGDAARTAAALTAELDRRGAGRGAWRTPELAARIAARRWRDEPFDDRAAEGLIDPRALSIALDDLLPPERTVVTDSGHFLGYPAMYLAVPDARGFVFPNAFQSVGLGLGCAIGAAIARPDRLCVAALGDGGAFMALPELETAARYRLRLLVVVYDDAAYGAEVHHFGPQGHAVDLTQFPDADLAALGRAAGADGVVVRSGEDLAAVGRWLEHGRGPLVVDAKVDPTVVAEWLEEAFRAH